MPRTHKGPVGQHPVQFNELGAMHQRHRVRGWGKSHHLKDFPADRSRIHEHAPLSDPGEAGVVREVIKTVQCNIGDASCYVGDDFLRTVASPSIAVGASVGATVTRELFTEYTDRDYVYRGITWKTIPIGNPFVSSYIGSGHYAYTGRPADSTCTGWDNAIRGWTVEEVWYHYTVPAHPANMAGIQIGLKAGYGAGRFGAVRVASARPIDRRGGSLVSTFETGTTGYIKIHVPGAYVPAEGGEIWVGITTEWDAEYGAECCGWKFPYESGCSNSGRFSLQDDGLWKWLTYSSGGASDWGTMPLEETTGAWWEGGNTLTFLGYTGSPVAYGMNEGEIYLTADAPSSLAFAYYGGDDATGEPGPWSWDGWRVNTAFEMDVLGNTAVEGQREIQYAWRNGNEDVTLHVYLGDEENAMGVGLTSGSTHARFDYTFAVDTQYGVSVDTRNGSEARLKVWPRGGNEPQMPQLVIPVSPGEPGDEFTVQVFAGNGAANPDQTVKVLPWWACGMGQECYWVDEWIGRGDGATTQFQTAQRYTRQSVQYRVDGFWTPVKEDDKEQGLAHSDLAPDLGAALRVRYLVDEEPILGDEDDGDEEVFP